MHRYGFKVAPLLFSVLVFACLHPPAGAADLGRSIIPQLQDRFGLTEAQVRGSLGALLIFVRERVPKTQFDGLLENIPDADFIMRDTRVRGIVKMPLDDIEDYEASLASLGVAPLIAAQFAPAVVEYLGAAGFTEEQSVLAGVLD